MADAIGSGGTVYMSRGGARVGRLAADPGRTRGLDLYQAACGRIVRMGWIVSIIGSKSES